MITKKTLKVEKNLAEDLQKWLLEKEVTPLSLLESLEKDVREMKGEVATRSAVLSLIKQYKEQLK